MCKKTLYYFMPYCLHVLLTFNHSCLLKTPFTFPAFAYAPAHCNHMSCIIFAHHFFLSLQSTTKKKNPPSPPFYTLLPWFTRFTSCFLLNTRRIYVADPSCRAEIEHTVISCSGFGSGQFPNHLSAYKSEALSGKHRQLDKITWNNTRIKFSLFSS